MNNSPRTYSPWIACIPCVLLFLGLLFTYNSQILIPDPELTVLPGNTVNLNLLNAERSLHVYSEEGAVYSCSNVAFSSEPCSYSFIRNAAILGTRWYAFPFATVAGSQVEVTYTPVVRNEFLLLQGHENFDNWKRKTSYASVYQCDHNPPNRQCSPNEVFTFPQDSYYNTLVWYNPMNERSEMSLALNFTTVTHDVIHCEVINTWRRADSTRIELEDYEDKTLIFKNSGENEIKLTIYVDGRSLRNIFYYIGLWLFITPAIIVLIISLYKFFIYNIRKQGPNDPPHILI
ncbi:hypothetical protein RCL1_004038 [Eukaryota sp. TZLM3-RCL]